MWKAVVVLVVRPVIMTGGWVVGLRRERAGTVRGVGGGIGVVIVGGTGGVGNGCGVCGSFRSGWSGEKRVSGLVERGRLVLFVWYWCCMCSWC